MVASSSFRLKIRLIAAIVAAMGVYQAQAASDATDCHRGRGPVAAAAGGAVRPPSPPGSGNCLGCFEATSGTCQLDVDKPGCLPATPPDCAALRLPYENSSATTWPEGWCLNRVRHGFLVMSHSDESQ